MTRDDVVQYWLNSAETDLAAMETLFRSGHFVWALFLGHLVLESRFHKRATVEFTQGYIHRIREFRNWLIEKIRS